MGNVGVCIVAYGSNAKREARIAERTVQEFSHLDIAIISDEIMNKNGIIFNSERTGREAKLSLYELSPFDYTMYLDADTRIASRDFTRPFNMLKDGFDFVIAASENQGGDFMSHADDEDREYTRTFIENQFPMQLQAGAFWFARNDRIKALFDAWKTEWEKFRRKDQGALMRALSYSQVRMWVLSSVWNCKNGAIINHMFGRAAQ